MYYLAGLLSGDARWHGLVNLVVELREQTRRCVCAWPPVKKMMLAMLGARKKFTGWPEGVSDKFPERVKPSLVHRAIREAHPALADQWYKDKSVHFMHTESKILLGAMVVLIGQDIPVLPIHDCVLVPESWASEAEEAMLASFEFYAGQRGRVTCKRP